MIQLQKKSELIPDHFDIAPSRLVDPDPEWTPVNLTLFWKSTIGFKHFRLKRKSKNLLEKAIPISKPFFLQTVFFREEFFFFKK
jgi:hypothetical protein